MSHYKHQQAGASVPVLLIYIVQLLELQSKQTADRELPTTSSLLLSAGVAEITWGQFIAPTCFLAWGGGAGGHKSTAR